MRVAGVLSLMNWKLVSTIALLTGVVFALAQPASAEQPKQAWGTETYVLTPTCNFLGQDPALPDCKLADGNMFMTYSNPGTKDGTFTGTHIANGTAVIFKDGSLLIDGIITFTGTVEGCYGGAEGTVVFKNEGKGYLDANGAAVVTRNHQSTLSGKGTLPVHANLDVIQTAPGATEGAVTGTYQCK